MRTPGNKPASNVPNDPSQQRGIENSQIHSENGERIYLTSIAPQADRRNCVRDLGQSIEDIKHHDNIGLRVAFTIMMPHKNINRDSQMDGRKRLRKTLLGTCELSRTSKKTRFSGSYYTPQRQNN